jgi:hypothetical protein
LGAAQHALNACYFGCRGRSFRGGTARTQCVLPRLLRAFFRGRHSAQSMRATSVAPCAGKSNFLVRGRRDAFAALRGYGCPDASGTEACQETTHVQSSWGGSEGERALTPRTRDDFLFFHHNPHPTDSLLRRQGGGWAEVTLFEVDKARSRCGLLRRLLATTPGTAMSQEQGRRDAFVTLRGYGCLDASGTEACQKAIHVQSSWGG